jgi:hypothetical protein
MSGVFDLKHSPISVYLNGHKKQATEMWLLFFSSFSLMKMELEGTREGRHPSAAFLGSLHETDHS